MNNTTTRWAMPTTPTAALAHLNGHHGWNQAIADPGMVQAHRYAHGVDNRPDLADAELDHTHSAPTRWPAPSGPGPGADPKKSKAGKVLLVVGVLVVIGIAVGSTTNKTGIGGVVSPATHTVTYKVEGTTDMASITYETASGDTAQQSDIDVPLTRKIDQKEGLILPGMHSGAFLYISAQNSRESGTITCIIEVDGIPVKSVTSRGGYTIATCSGRL